MGNKKGNGLDQFYTNIDVAKLCVDTIDTSKYDIVIEPSAGTGAFYNLIDHPNKVGIDLEPKCEGVEKQDFLNWDGDIFKDFNFWPPPKVLTIGNPPFGKQSSLAIKFIKHASIFSTTIAFILPRSFKKISMYDKVPLNFWNVNQFDIPPYSFTFDGKKYDVPCVWIEYEKRNEFREKQKRLEPKTFKFVKVTEYVTKVNKKGKEYTTGVPPKEANVSIARCGVNAGTASKNIDVATPGTFFIKVDDDKISEFIQKVNTIKFNRNTNTGPISISKNDLIKKIEGI